MAVGWLWDGSGMAVGWQWDGSGMAVEWQWGGCGMAVGWQWGDCGVGVITRITEELTKQMALPKLTANPIRWAEGGSV